MGFFQRHLESVPFDVESYVEHHLKQDFFIVGGGRRTKHIGFVN
jgi:hypothetical protein